MAKSIIVCSFSAVDAPRGQALTYEALKAAVVKAGRFSAFEASASNKIGLLYTRLCHDPEIEIDRSPGYPWTLVRLRTPSAKEHER